MTVKNMGSGNLAIIVVNWNTCEMTLECLESIDKVHRIGNCIEVVVVDNASTDESVERICDRFPAIRLIENDQNLGFAAANNQGMRLTSAKYVLLLNSDTLILGDVLAASVRYMDQHCEVGILGCRVLNADRSLQLTCFDEPTLLNLLLKVTGLFKLAWPRWCSREHMPWWRRDTERDVGVVTGCYMMVRNAAIRQVGLLDERFFFCGEETDWCRRFREAGWKVRLAPVGEIVHYGNASGRRFEYRRDLMLTAGLVRFHRKHGGLLAAVLAWLILYAFNFSRLVFWSIAAAFTGRSKAICRRVHFRGIVKEFGRVWPRAGRECAFS